MYTPWPHQEPAIAAMVAANGVIKAPAGAGKTLIGMRAIHKVSVPTLWLAHTIDLVKQAARAAQKYMPGVGRVGMLAEGITDWGDGKLVVATAQTLQGNTSLIEALNGFIGMVVVDEAHHFPAEMFYSVVCWFKARHLKGVTATPQRKDRQEKVMLLGVGPILHEVPREILYDKGILIKPTIEFIYTEFCKESASDRNEIDAVDAGGDDFDYVGLIQELCKDEDRVELIAREIIKEVAGNCQLVLSDNIRYLYRLRDKVRKLWQESGADYPVFDGVIHGSLQRYAWYVAKNEDTARQMVTDGLALDFRYSKGLKRWEIKQEQYTAAEMEAWQINPRERAERIEALRQKKLHVVFATAQLVQEGLDIPHLTVGHLATPKRGDSKNTKREKGREDGSAVEQAIGRLQRRDPDNPNKVAIWKDYVDYNVGVFKDQYLSRRKVYKRLGLVLPKKAAVKSSVSQLDDWLGTMPY
ncbi:MULTISPECIES: DEAD/DEAH box helicase [Pelosinus]|nr:MULTISPECIES: DEAD/DEAH box helicase family protein [Pelosinus]